MDNLVPPTLIFIRDVRSALEDGRSVKQGIEFFLSRSLSCDFRSSLIQWWTSQFQKSTSSAILLQPTAGQSNRRQPLAPHLVLLLELLERGLRGDSIAAPLSRLEEEVLRLAQDEIQKEIDLMPFRLLIPALLFFFPGLMCLLIGPILSEVLEMLGG